MSASGGSSLDPWSPDLPSLIPGAPSFDRVLECLLENVLAFLTDARDRNAASLVCRAWHRVEALTRRHLTVSNCYAVTPRRATERFPFVCSVTLKGKPRLAYFRLVPHQWGARAKVWVTAFLASYPRLEKLYLKRMTVSDVDLEVIAKGLTGFRELSLVSCDGFTTLGLAAIAEHCRNLQVLDLIEAYAEIDEDEDTAVDWISKFPQTTTSLKSLIFDCIDCKFNFEALESLVVRSPLLRRLKVNHHVTLEQLRRLLACAPQLTHLGTGSFEPEAGGGGDGISVYELAASFVASKSLTCLSGFWEIDPAYLSAISPVCESLTTLDLSIANIAADDLKPVICSCHKLRKFWVLDTVGDEGLRAVADTCRDLRELRVFPLDPEEDSEVSVSHIGLQAISEGCRKLESILYFCQRMTNSAVVAMSCNCPDLVVFRLCIMRRHLPDFCTGEPMDEGFAAIVMNCKKLSRFSVSGLLTDRAFKYIGLYGKLIKTISIAFAGNSDLSLRYLLEGCHNLQKLEIRGSPFGDAGLLSGIQHYYKMRFLWMNSCEVTLRGCREVARRLPHLVVEAIDEWMTGDEVVEKLYLYRSTAGPRDDAPAFVKIL